MTTAKFCDICQNPYREGAAGSLNLTINASYGVAQLRHREMDICPNCNPFLQLAKKELEEKIQTSASYGIPEAGPS